jgi:hypothetical protein
MNHKLIVGEIFYDLEKAFDCVNHNTLLAKLKFYGINGRYLALYKSYHENRYQILYDDKQTCNKFPSLAKVLHYVPQGCFLKPLLFLIYINDLPKIINGKSIPRPFVDDTRILVACNNFIDFNNNIHKVFKILNKRFKVNLLSLNFNKMHFTHLTTMRSKTVD